MRRLYTRTIEELLRSPAETSGVEQAGARDAEARDAEAAGLRQAGPAGHPDRDSPATQRLLMLQRTAGNRAVSGLLDEPEQDLSGQVGALLGARQGLRLDPGVRADMQARLGADFSGVRIHRGRQAERTAAALGARAFTVGTDVVFGEGAYDPGGSRGRQTLAHELTHVMQQGRGGVDARPAAEGLRVSDPHDRCEREAEDVAAAVLRPGAYPAEQAPAGTEPAARRQAAESTEDTPAGMQAAAARRQAAESTEDTPAGMQPASARRQAAEPAAAGAGPVPAGENSGLVVQRLPRVGDPSVTTSNPDTQRHEQIRSAASRELPVHAEIFANLWLSAATSALSVAPEPEDEVARLNWWVALSGNLTWAATSLVAPELSAAIIAMSFGGAAVGSGSAALDTAPSGKEFLLLSLAKARDAMVTELGTMIPRVAEDCAQAGETDIEAQRRRLWAAMLPGVPFNSSEAIVAQMSGRITNGLQQFMEQYKAWEAAGGGPRRVEEYLRNRSLVEKLLDEPPDPLSLDYRLRLEWRRTHPFEPHLTY